jgi:hypothetical protein
MQILQKKNLNAEIGWKNIRYSTFVGARIIHILVTDINISKIKSASPSGTEQQEYCCLYYVRGCTWLPACVHACMHAYASPFNVLVCSPWDGHEYSRLSSSICIPRAYQRLVGRRTTLIGHMHWTAPVLTCRESTWMVDRGVSTSFLFTSSYQVGWREGSAWLQFPDLILYLFIPVRIYVNVWN